MAPQHSADEQAAGEGMKRWCQVLVGECAPAALRDMAGVVREGRSAEDSSLENSLIIFDWDDTLLPTTYILQTVLPSLPAEDREGAVPRSSPFYEDTSGSGGIEVARGPGSSS